jgi:hypothetical protein
MWHSLRLGRSLIAAAAIIWGVASGTPASALTITPAAGCSQCDPVEVTADGSFVGLVDGGGAAFLAGTASFTDATGFAPFNGNEAEEAALLTTECACGTTFVATGKIEEDDLTSWTVTDPFFSIKKDGWVAFFHNLAGSLTITTSTDVSHSTFFVPFPAVGAGLPGLVLACGGLLALARRRRSEKFA